MARIVLDKVSKIFKGPKGEEVRAVNNVSLTIEDQEFLVLVGPSGCGKSTTLRMMAGLEEVSRGAISIDGKVVNDVEPKDRKSTRLNSSHEWISYAVFCLKKKKKKKKEYKYKKKENNTYKKDQYTRYYIGVE